MNEQADLREQVASVRWLHSIDLGHGIITPGEDPHHRREAYMAIPERLDGLRVLDIGTWDGYFAFLAERRGASEVVAIDVWQPWGSGSLSGLHSNRAAFDIAHRALGSKVIPIEMSVYDLRQDRNYFIDRFLARFDLVFFFGVLYHLKHPLLALEKIRAICPRGLLILETHLDFLHIKRPVSAWYPNAEAVDDTNWNGPNPACVEAWLRTAGFSGLKFMGGVNLDSWPPENEKIAYARGCWHAR